MLPTLLQLQGQVTRNMYISDDIDQLPTSMHDSLAMHQSTQMQEKWPLHGKPVSVLLWGKIPSGHSSPQIGTIV